MWRSLSLAGPWGLMALGAAPSALAQEEDGAWSVRSVVTLAGSAMASEASLAPPADGFLASALVSASRADTFENGLTLTWRGAVRFERDAGSRPAFAGVLGLCPPQTPSCPRIPAAGGFLAPVAPSTGLSLAGASPPSEGFIAIEAAAVTLGGPWGDGEIGYGSGAASRLDARPAQVMERLSAFSPGLDATGLSLTRARNDVTGSSLKATYLSPRWIGLRVGASFTPKATQRSGDYDPDPETAGRLGARLENVWEGGASFARQFSEEDLRVRAGLTYLTADARAAPASFGRYEAWGGGLEIERAGFTGGVRWLSSNNAWKSGKGGYTAFEASLVHDSDLWRVGLEFGRARDALTGLSGSSWLVGATRHVSPSIDLSLGWSSAAAALPAPAGLGLTRTRARNQGPVIELTVRN